MGKKIGIFAAAIVFAASVDGTVAASLSQDRLNELLASSDRQNVSMQSLRSRDREILEDLAQSLATRYGDLLAGSEMIFTRIIENGTVYYRLDFANLKNKDHARGLCEILEMDRCIARIGDDILSVLDVKSDPLVQSISVIAKPELDRPETPFEFEQSPDPAPNPLARQIEARARAALDPLRSYPKLREFSGALDKEQPEPKKNVQPVELSEAGVDLEAAPLLRDAALRRARAISQLPILRASALPEGRHFAMSDTARQHPMSPGGPTRYSDSDLVEVALAEPDVATDGPGITIPGLGRIDLGKLKVAPSRMEIAKPMVAGVNVSRKAPIETETPSVSIADTEVEAPQPVLRVAAIAEQAARLEEVGRRQALEAGLSAPKPRLREIALIDRSTPPQVMTEIAQMSPDTLPEIALTQAKAPQPAVERAPHQVPAAPLLRAAMPVAEHEAPVEVATRPALRPDREERKLAAAPVWRPGLKDLSGLIPDGPEAPEASDRKIAETAKRIAQSDPAQTVTKDSERAVRTLASDLSVDRAPMATGELGRVVFDDVIAQPAMIDFSGGRHAGRLQKLPLLRPTRIDDGAGLAGRLLNARQALLSQAAPGVVELAQVPQMTKSVEKAPVAQKPAVTAPPRKETLAIEDILKARAAKAEPAARPAMPSAKTNVEREGDKTVKTVAPEPAVVKPLLLEAKDRVDAPTAPKKEAASAPAPRPAAPEAKTRVVQEQPAQAQAVKLVRSKMQRTERNDGRGNLDLTAAQELAGTRMEEKDMRSDMQRRADPLVRNPAPAQSAREARRFANVPASALRIELSYVDEKSQIGARVAEIKKRLPGVILEKGRFFGASHPDQPGRFIVGFVAKDAKARQEIIWYLEKMQIPWAIR